MHMQGRLEVKWGIRRSYHQYGKMLLEVIDPI